MVASEAAVEVDSVLDSVDPLLVLSEEVVLDLLSVLLLVSLDLSSIGALGRP